MNVLRLSGDPLPRIHPSLPPILAGLLATVACSPSPSSGGGSPDGAVAEPAPDVVRRDRPEWHVQTLQAGGYGLRVDLERGPGGGLAAAWFASNPEIGGACEELKADSPPDERRWPLRFARSTDGVRADAAVEWTVETAMKPRYVGTPPGLDLEPSPSGSWSLAGMTGEPVAKYGFCGVNDVALYTRRSAGKWSAETAVEESDEAETGHAGSDAGTVVGYWPALAYGPEDEPAIAYKDVHTGSAQSDDFRRSDLEWTHRSGGSWRAVPVDPGRGGGHQNAMVFDSEGRALIAYRVPVQSEVESRVGVWVARSGGGGDGWSRVHLFPSKSPTRPAITVDARGRVHVLFYNAERGFPQLATLVAPSAFESTSEGWRLDRIETDGRDEGYDPTLAVSPSGRLWAAYYRCGRASGGLGNCRAEEDGLVAARRTRAGWTREVVDAGGDDGFCGRVPSLAFDANGRPSIAYRCESRADGELSAAVRFARRR
ncbi:MAG: hypothetical protein ABEL76_09215 [Bradymonadaceae bacterium]